MTWRSICHQEQNSIHYRLHSSIHDGYASSGAPLMNGGRKISYTATLPYAIIGDTDIIMKNAPMKMILAGYGDIIENLQLWPIGNFLMKSPANIIVRRS